MVCGFTSGDGGAAEGRDAGANAHSFSVVPQVEGLGVGHARATRRSAHPISIGDSLCSLW